MSTPAAQLNSAISETNPIYLARRRKNQVLMGVSLAMLIYGLAWLAWILITLLWEGASALRPEHTLASYAKAIADGADSSMSFRKRVELASQEPRPNSAR